MSKSQRNAWTFWANCAMLYVLYDVQAATLRLCVGRKVRTPQSSGVLPEKFIFPDGTGGNPRESATENIPPMACKGTGKVENVW
jgi:hypothetical protein